MTIYLLEIAGYGLLLFFAALTLEKLQSGRVQRERWQVSFDFQKLLKEAELAAAGSARTREAKSSANR